MGRRPTVLGALLAAGVVVLGACTSAGPVASTGSARPSSSVGTASAPPSTAAGAPSLTVTLPGGSSRVWSVAQLLELPRTRVTAADGSTVAAVSLPTLTGYDAPARPVGPDPRLLVVYRVSGTGTPQPMTFTRAESEASVGDHPALVTLSADGRLDVVVPQDRTTARSVLGVDSVVVTTVDVPPPSSPAPSSTSSSAPSSAPSSGSVEVDAGGTRRVVDVAALPRHDYTLTRPGAAATQQQGARLDEVLDAAGVRSDDASLVTVVGATGQVAVLTVGEVTQAQEQVGLSLAEDARPLPRPQLVVGGDVSAARTVTAVTRIVVAG